MNKRDAARAIAKARKVIASGRHVPCPCPVVTCKAHGDCYQCVLGHRLHKLHVPVCFQPMLREKILALAELAEMKMAPPPGVRPRPRRTKT